MSLKAWFVDDLGVRMWVVWTLAVLFVAYMTISVIHTHPQTTVVEIRVSMEVPHEQQ